MKKIDDYKIIKKIGSGGFSKVYKVKKDNQIYALKKMDNLLGDFDKIKEEISSLKLMNTYKNGIKFYEAVRKEDFIYLVFDYVQGGTLHHMINEGYTFNFETAKTFILDILEQIEFINTHNRLHFDISPYNILKKDNKFLLIDWGISEAIRDLYPTFHRGYKVYSAPEIFDGKKSLSSEIYALACCLHFCLTKRIIYNLGRQGESLELRMYKHKYFKPYLDDIKDEKLKYLLYRMLEKNYKNRATIKEIKEILKDDFTPPKEYKYQYEKADSNIDLNNNFLLLKKLANDNTLFAKDFLAKAYERGVYEKINLINAFFMYKQSMKSGLLESASNLGVLFYKGLGVEQNYARAYEIFKKSISHERSMYYLGKMLEENLCPNERHEKDFKYWYKKSAFAGYGLAMEKVESLNLDLEEDFNSLLE